MVTGMSMTTRAHMSTLAPRTLNIYVLPPKRVIFVMDRVVLPIRMRMRPSMVSEKLMDLGVIHLILITNLPEGVTISIQRHLRPLIILVPEVYECWSPFQEVGYR